MLDYEESTSSQPKDEVLEFIRDEIREVVQSSRKQHRDFELNKKRALGEQFDEFNYDIEFIINTAKHLKKRSLSKEEYNKLQNALLQSEEHINSFLKVDNIIHALVRDLSGSSSQAKYLAACCCCNIALGNAKTCHVLCKYVAPYLVAELESTSDALVEICAWTIGNLCISSKAFSILQAQDCIKSLIKLAHQSSDSYLPIISYACKNYVYAGCDSIPIGDLMELGSIFINKFPKVADINTVWLLALLSSKDKFMNILINYTNEISDHFLETVNNPNESISKMAAMIQILGNLVSEETGQVAEHFLNKAESVAFDKLLLHQCFFIRKQTLWLIGNLYNHKDITTSLNAVGFIHTHLINSLKLAIDLVKSCDLK